MKKSSYVWSVIVGFIEIGITLSIFDYFYDDFQTKVLAILVIIYTTIRTIGLGLGQTLTNMTYGISVEFRKLRGDDLDEEEKFNEARKQIDYQNTKSIINGIIIAIMYFIAVYKLFVNL